jgi:cation diffusion facilitator family transporter
MRAGEKTAFAAFIANILLFFLKLSAAIASGSLAVLSSAFDSLSDIVSYFLGYYSIREAARGPDYDHPFGHRRLEPLAGLVVAILAGILSFEIIRSVFFNILNNEHMLDITAYTFGILIITIFTKAIMHVILRRKAQKTMSTALDAMAVDSRNDVLSNSIAIIGVGGAYLGQLLFDDAAAIIIALYIAYSGYQVARKNYNYIVGARPDEKTIKSIIKKAQVDGVTKVGKVRAHYVGDRVHTEVEVVLSRKISAKKSHDTAVRVQKAVESLKIVSRAFVHVDYE